jgi:hypothetical protein
VFLEVPSDQKGLIYLVKASGWKGYFIQEIKSIKSHNFVTLDK